MSSLLFLAIVFSLPCFFGGRILVRVTSLFRREVSRIGMAAFAGMAFGVLLAEVLMCWLSAVHLIVLGGILPSMTVFTLSLNTGSRRHRALGAVFVFFFLGTSFFKSDVSSATLQAQRRFVGTSLVENWKTTGTYMPESSTLCFTILLLAAILVVLTAVRLMRSRETETLRDREGKFNWLFGLLGTGAGISTLSLFWNCAIFLKESHIAWPVFFLAISLGAVIGTTYVRRLTLAGRPNAIHGLLLLAGGALALLVVLYPWLVETSLESRSSGFMLLRAFLSFVFLIPYGILGAGVLTLALSLVGDGAGADHA